MPSTFQTCALLVYTYDMGIDSQGHSVAKVEGKTIARSREHGRYDCGLQVSYEAEPGQLQKATTANISTAGLFVKTASLPETPMIMLEVSISHARTVFLWSEVRHRNNDPSKMDVGFGVTIPAAPSVWREYCERLGQN